jgi:hypothetical protein
MFKPTGVLVGESLDKMKEDYETQLEKEFLAHVCVKHPKPSDPKN